MSRASEIERLLLPWTGLVVGLGAVAVSHQYGSDGAFDTCPTFLPIPALLVSTVAIAVTIIGALASWTVFRRAEESAARKVVSIISSGVSVFFVLAMLLPMCAALILPRCFQ